jgi:hypothetical protein
MCAYMHKTDGAYWPIYAAYNNEVFIDLYVIHFVLFTLSL